MPNRDISVTVTRPWRVVWQAHLDHPAGEGDGFTLGVCQPQTSGLITCIQLVYDGAGTGTTAPVTNPYNDVDLSVSICCDSSTWSLDVEEMS